MIANVGIVNHLRPHIGDDKVLFGNRETLKITYIGDASLSSGSSKLPLENVLFIPYLEQNLLFVR